MHSTIVTVLFTLLVVLLTLSVVTEARPQLPTMLETLHFPGGTAYDTMAVGGGNYVGRR
ncbi:hypothetical protein AAVH_16607 [Aphelenchoides avenae]|nr:hypothetical protein AAVH_16607 [Aphelenchus avenae]